MKKTFSILLALTLLLFSGCAKQGATTVTDEAQPITYQIYCAAPQSALANESATEQTIFLDASQINLYATTTEMIQVEGDQADSKKVVIANESFDTTKIRIKKTSYSTSQNKKLQSFGCREVYATADGKIEFTFRQNSDQLIGFLAYDRNGYDGNISKEDARKCADQFLIQIYGENAAKTYTHVIESRDSRFTHYKFYYCKAINGIPTTDRIAIGINMQGELYSINANNYGILDAFDTKITEKQVSAAEAALMAAISPSYQIKEHGLAIDPVSGICYLSIVACRETENGTVSEQFYINVN